MDKPVASPSLEAFRSGLYACFGRRRDALFELGDALLSGSSFPSPVHLSLEPSHRRGWGSLYAALAHGQVDVNALQALVAGTAPPDIPPVYAVDISVWPRCDAETSRERGYYYHPSRHSAVPSQRLRPRHLHPEEVPQVLPERILLRRERKAHGKPSRRGAIVVRGEGGGQASARRYRSSMSAK